MGLRFVGVGVGVGVCVCVLVSTYFHKVKLVLADVATIVDYLIDIADSILARCRQQIPTALQNISEQANKS